MVLDGRTVRQQHQAHQRSGNGQNDESADANCEAADSAQGSTVNVHEIRLRWHGACTDDVVGFFALLGAIRVQYEYR